MKRKIAILLAITMGLCAGCGNDNNNEVSQNSDNQNTNIEKPKELTILAETFMPWENNEDDVKRFSEAYKQATGIDLKVLRAEKSEYYEKINILLATDDSVDIFETGSLFYPNYAMYDLLWDMTNAWENSSIKDITNQEYVDALKIDGKLYGFPLTAGNGTVTYVRQDWLDKLGLQQPKTYEEFHNMLVKFKTLGNDIIPLTAAGLVNSEAPYTLYLREFYQNASPDFYLKDGKYVDGMTEPEMKEALTRMKQAFSEGLIDHNIVKNKTSDCRNKFYEGTVGCFNYWAGTWGKTMDSKVKAKNPEGKVVPLTPLSGVKYLERPPLALVISKNSKAPEAAFKYFIEYSHDGGDGQMLFTYGVENYDWHKTADNKVVMDRPKDNAVYLKPELSINNFQSPVPINNEIKEGIKLFNANSELAPIPVTSKEVGDLFAEIDITRREIIEAVVTTDMTIDEGMKEYDVRAAKIVKRVLNKLNGDNKDNNENTKQESKEE